ncbi:MAG: hypothetical protein SNH63_05855 [Rikenellaceae bacterium]
MKVQMKPVVVYDIENSDLLEIYAHFALTQYQWLRKPDYNKRLATEILLKDMRRYLLEMQIQVQRDPNNKNLNNIQLFFDRHYNRLKNLLEE